MSAEAPPTISDVDSSQHLIDADAFVSTLAAIGFPGEWRDRASRYPAVICAGVIVREFARVQAGCERPTRIGARTLLMAGVHVGHDAIIGADCEIAPNAVVGGCVTIGKRVKVGMGAVILPHVMVGDDVRIGAGAVVTKTIPDGETWVGNPAKRLHKWDGTA